MRPENVKPEPPGRAKGEPFSRTWGRAVVARRQRPPVRLLLHGPRPRRRVLSRRADTAEQIQRVRRRTTTRPGRTPMWSTPPKRSAPGKAITRKAIEVTLRARVAKLRPRTEITCGTRVSSVGVGRTAQSRVDIGTVRQPWRSIERINLFDQTITPKSPRDAHRHRLVLRFRAIRQDLTPAGDNLGRCGASEQARDRRA